MAVLRKKQEEEGGEGAPIWIISFADMSSLLMAFFVMLSTFSSFGTQAAEELKGVCRKIVSSGGWNEQQSYKALLPQPKSVNADSATKGSEKPTLDKNSNDKSMKETSLKDYRTHKVFLIESNKMFWSKGEALTSEGRQFLQTLASFANKIPSRIVISEYGADNPQLGLHRAWAGAEVLIEAGVSPDMCNISAQSMCAGQEPQSERMFEITLLDKAIYR
jgi:chemotaxis protein MotB